LSDIVFALMAAAKSIAPDLAPLVARLGEVTGDRKAEQAAARAVVEHSPDERLALAFMLRLAEQDADAMRTRLRDPSSAADLAVCLGGSEIAAAELAAAGVRWSAIFDRARTLTARDLTEAIHCDFIDAATRAAGAQALGDFKGARFVEIAIADLLHHIDVMDTAALMSRLADECIRAAYALARRLAGPAADAAGEFCVLAMGKLGAGELNLSSDIDLIYLYDAPNHPDAAVAAARLGEAITEMLAAGCFRVDLRLRPGGRNSPLAIPLEAALSFYQNLGQTWERAALLRARPVAGAVAVGSRMLSELEPFVYRRFLDFDTLRQLRAMKRQVEAELRSTAMVERNIKLGRGGIRELEFVVQALTLIYGGRDPRLRTERTLDALSRLRTHGYLSPERARRLADAYLFLRDVEHKLQVAAGRQTHTLPADESAMRALAARMGFGKQPQSAARMLERLSAHRAMVAAQFREMLAGSDQESAARGSAQAEAAWTAALDPQVSAPILAALGFARPDESAGHLEFLARGPEHPPTSPRRHELLDRICPLLLDEMKALPDPDLALMNVASFVAAVGARTSFLALLEQHPATRRVLMRLFASSAYLSTIFIRHPDMLDTLVRSDLVHPRRALEVIRQELAGLVAAATDFESRLDVLRTFRHQEFLRVAIADLAGDLALPDVERELTNLAEAALGEALKLAFAEVAARQPIPPQLRLVILAMGRLGAGEMTYNSDLDLIFVYDDRADTNAGAVQIAARVAQKLIAILESRTREGYVYKLDLRLRPSGNQGPLVTSLASFREYHRQSSAVWERLALVRGRVVAGDASLGAEVESARREFVFGRALGAAGVAEIAAMRTRMEREIGAENKTRLNLKQGRGGLVDVEFLAQMMALRHGHARPELRERGTRRLLEAMRTAGVVSDADGRELTEDFQFLSRLENRLRIESDEPAWAVSTDPAALLPLARRMGFQGEEGPERMLDELAQRRARIRVNFDRYFAAEQRAN
jgi:[glutamine synthetase] adenylyltransferase / [glutamine synthetase]-adenylyl-L-tyrosine phosphorylase